jgi:hypothetical protein
MTVPLGILIFDFFELVGGSASITKQTSLLQRRLPVEPLQHDRNKQQHQPRAPQDLETLPLFMIHPQCSAAGTGLMSPATNFFLSKLLHWTNTATTFSAT